MISETFMHLRASLFDHHHSLHHITSVFVPFSFFSYCFSFLGASDNLKLNIIYNQEIDVCGTAAVREKIMS